MKDRGCMKVIPAPPDSVWAKHHRIVSASRSIVEQVRASQQLQQRKLITWVSNLRTVTTTGLDCAEENPAIFANKKAGELEDWKMRMSREFCGAKTLSSLWKHLGKVSWQTGLDHTSTWGTRKIATDVEWLRVSENYVWRSTPPPSNLVAKC